MNDSMISEIMKLGSTSKREAAMALQTYIDLSEVKKYWDVEYKYSESVGCLYLTAKKSKRAKHTIFVPISVSDKLSFQAMQKYIEINDGDKNVCLVICTADSTCVYYQISDGIGDPPPIKPQRSRETDRQIVDKILSKHHGLLADAAMYGIPITLSKEEIPTCSNDS